MADRVRDPRFRVISTGPLTPTDVVTSRKIVAYAATPNQETPLEGLVYDQSQSAPVFQNGIVVGDPTAPVFAPRAVDPVVTPFPNITDNGVNLLFNGDVEKGDTRGWLAFNANTVLAVAGGAQAGTSCVSMTATAQGQIGVMGTTGVNGIKVLPSFGYRFKGYLFTGIQLRTFTLIVTWYDATGATISSNTTLYTEPSTGVWNQFDSYPIQAPATAAYAGWTLTSPIINAGEIHYADSFQFYAISGQQGDTTIMGSGSIHSYNYIPNVSGWGIDGLGNSEFNNTIVRGTMDSAYAKSSTIQSVDGPELLPNVLSYNGVAGLYYSPLYPRSDGQGTLDNLSGLNADNANTTLASGVSVAFNTIGATVTAIGAGTTILSTSYGTAGIAVTAGSWYWVAADVGADSVARAAQVVMNWWDVNGNFLNSTSSASALDSLTAWQRRTCVGKAPVGAVFLSVQVQFTSVGAGEKHYVRRIMVSGKTQVPGNNAGITQASGFSSEPSTGTNAWIAADANTTLTEVTDATLGIGALKLVAIANAAVSATNYLSTADYAPAVAGDVVTVTWWSLATTAIRSQNIAFDWYDQTHTLLSTSTVGAGNNTTSWAPYVTSATAPANSVYVRVRFILLTPAAAEVAYVTRFVVGYAGAYGYSGGFGNVAQAAVTSVNDAFLGLTANGQAVTDFIPVTPNLQYRALAYYLANVAPTAVEDIYIDWYNANLTLVGVQIRASSTPNQWWAETNYPSFKPGTSTTAAYAAATACWVFGTAPATAAFAKVTFNFGDATQSVYLMGPSFKKVSSISGRIFPVDNLDVPGALRERTGEPYQELTSTAMVWKIGATTETIQTASYIRWRQLGKSVVGYFYLKGLTVAAAGATTLVVTGMPTPRTQQKNHGAGFDDLAGAVHGVGIGRAFINGATANLMIYLGSTNTGGTAPTFYIFKADGTNPNIALSADYLSGSFSYESDQALANELHAS